MTKTQHNYTNPFRKDPPLVRCDLCDKPATYAFVTEHGFYTARRCDDHKPKTEKREAPDVREVRPEG